ncbi:hypothetical protein ACFYVR_14060 [Rhodococcus sp. NPDC003318]|uniref:hypothetical protein n=1 Tax=Rhodococcus sp. NPDC003318 TaxID=3364503 RepID=UPI0036ABABF8
MSATRKQKVLTQLELMIESTNPDFAPPAPDEDSRKAAPEPGHERLVELHRLVIEAGDDDPIVDEAAAEIDLPD